MFKNEVNYRLAKWILGSLKFDRVITDEEMQIAWQKIAEHYEPPLLAIDTVGGAIGEEVTIGVRANCNKD